MQDLLYVRPFVTKDVWIRSFKIMGRVIQYRPGRFKLSGMVLASEGEQFYSPVVGMDGSYYCDCKGYEGVETICSHILALLRKSEFDGVDIRPYVGGLIGKPMVIEEMIYETSIKGYNKLFGGLNGGRHISALVSLPEVGKSYINAQFAVDMAIMHKKSSVIIDTEGGFAPEWIKLIADRFGVTVPLKEIDFRVHVENKEETIQPNFDYKKLKIEGKALEENDEPTVYLYDARHLTQIYPFFGRPLSFKIKSGIIEPIEFGKMVSIENSPLGLICDKCNIGYVANDSLSMPIENMFTGGQMNYRTRTKATQVWLARAQELIDEYRIVFMNTAHATIAHNNPYAVPTPVGGKAVLHNNKYIAYIEKANLKADAKKQGVDFHNLRRMSIFRHMTKAAWSDICYMMTTGAGVVDYYKLGTEPDDEAPLPSQNDDDIKDDDA